MKDLIFTITDVPEWFIQAFKKTNKMAADTTIGDNYKEPEDFRNITVRFAPHNTMMDLFAKISGCVQIDNMLTKQLTDEKEKVSQEDSL